VAVILDGHFPIENKWQVLPLAPTDSAQYNEPIDFSLFEDCVTVPINTFKSYDRTLRNTLLEIFRCWREI
jgi:hypothetical protein